MRRLIRLPFLFAVVLSLNVVTGCERIELPEETGEGDEVVEVPDDTDTPVTPDDSETTDTLTISEAFQMTAGRVCVKGYIVGYVSGSTMRGAVLGLPDAPNTSMLIADNPYETDPLVCMPVRLEADTYRPVLNLYDHPDYYRRLIGLSGQIELYYGLPGIRDIEDYNWPTLHADEGQLALPSLDDSLQHVDDGRSVSE